MFPEQASTIAPRVDHIYFYLIGFSVVATVLIVALIVGFSIRYRARPGAQPADIDRENWKLEAAWIVIPFIIIMIAFGWGARLFVTMSTPMPANEEIHVVGKQWMWHVRHPGGRREINELHVPRGRAIQITLSSEDVVHSFFVPAFRVKQDAVPGRFTALWFEATRTGVYHLFCTEYCGTDHALMRGRVVVLEPAEYQRWLRATDDPLARAGERLFQDKRCADCHSGAPDATGPNLVGRFGHEVKVQGRDEPVVFDLNYLRQSVLDPQAKIAAGYPAVMPTYRGRLTTEEIVAIAAYLESGGEME
jgi:cytochrome c oxidase subunit II